MKKVTFEILIDEKNNKLATAWKCDGYSRDSVTDNLELIGILENAKILINERLQTIINIKR